MKTYTLQLTQAELQNVLNALVTRPYTDVALLLNNIQEQIKTQEEAPSEASQ